MKINKVNDEISIEYYENKIHIGSLSNKYFGELPIDYAKEIAEGVLKVLSILSPIVDGIATRDIKKGETIWLPTEEYESVIKQDDEGVVAAEEGD